jgi:hypothetical protein
MQEGCGVCSLPQLPVNFSMVYSPLKFPQDIIHLRNFLPLEGWTARSLSCLQRQWQYPSSGDVMVPVSPIKQRLRRDYFRWRHTRVVRGVLQTPALPAGNLPFILLSMVQKKDVLSYLVALKSFAVFANPQRIVVVCDPSIDLNDRALLTQHVPHIELRAADEFVHPEIPRGGTWERLLAICSYAEENYVVQLDADTVTVGAPGAVLNAIENRTGFVLGEEARQSLLSLAQATANAKADHEGQSHIQGFAEACMAEVGLPASRLYVRGCSGFTGFPQSSGMLEQLLQFSIFMSNRIGRARWSSWGTEQITSNYLVANAAGTRVLPFPAYATPDAMDEGTVFIHFIGSIRFSNDKYEKTSRTAIQRMTASNSQLGPGS